MSGQAHSGVLQLVESLRFLWKCKWWIVCGLVAGGAGAIGVVSSADRVYRAEAVVVPVSSRQRGGIAGIGGDLGGLAAIAGINLQSSNEERVAIATLRGKDFTAKFIKDNNLLPVLYPDRWDAPSGSWRGNPPTMIQAVDRFERGGIRKIIEDRQSGLFTIQIEWRDPEQAVAWLTSMVARVNAELRDQAVAESRKSIEFLLQEAGKTQSLEVRDTIFRLVETQMKQSALAVAQDEYALKFVDRPLLPEKLDYIWPRRVFILGVGLLIGAFMSVALAALVTVFRRARATQR